MLCWMLCRNPRAQSIPKRHPRKVVVLAVAVAVVVEAVVLVVAVAVVVEAVVCPLLVSS